MNPDALQIIALILAAVFSAFAVLLFAAVILAVEGAWLWWSGTHGGGARRIARRLELMAARGFSMMGRQMNGAGPRVACQMQAIDEVRHAQTQIHALSNYNRHYNGFHSPVEMLQKVWILRKVLNELSSAEAMELLIEKIKGSRINPKFANIANAIGFALLILLMIVVTYRDIAKLL